MCPNRATTLSIWSEWGAAVGGPTSRGALQPRQSEGPPRADEVSESAEIYISQRGTAVNTGDERVSRAAETDPGSGQPPSPRTTTRM